MSRISGENSTNKSLLDHREIFSYCRIPLTFPYQNSGVANAVKTVPETVYHNKVKKAER